MVLVVSPVPPFESRSEWVVAGVGVSLLLVALILDVAIGTRLFSRYWPVIGVLFGVGMLAVHRLVAPDEW